MSLNIFKWYVLYTHPNFEKKVYTSLNQRGIICFLPVKKIVRQWSDRKKIVEIPLFPNYIFIFTTINDRFKALDVFGTVKYISFNGLPATISENEIMTIKKLMIDPDVTLEQCLEGDHVNITQGPFKGLAGVVFERKGKTRFGVKLETINRSLSVEFNELSIEKVRK